MSTPTALYLSIGPYQEIISGISTVFSFSDGVVKLTGPLGAGKSSLLQELARELRGENFEVVDFKTPPKSVEELQATLIRKFKLGADLSFRKSLIRYLATKPRDLQKLILIIDDAHQMSTEALAGLHTLRDLDNNGQALISLLLCGDKTLNAHLAHPDLAALQADISLNYSLNPLEDEELSEFCSGYLQYLGKGRIALIEGYLEGLQDRSRGLPAEILGELEVVLRDPHFLFHHKRSDLPPEPVEAPPAMLGQMINSIAEQINNIPPETKRWLKPTFNTLVAVAAVSTVYVYYPRMVGLYGELMHSGAPSSASSQPQVAINNPAPAPAAPAQQPAATPAPTPVPAPQPQATQPAVATAPVNTAPAEQAPTAAAPAVAAPRPTPATAPAIAAVTSPSPTAPTTAAASSTDLAAVVNRWMSAWQQQDANKYLAFYHTDFASLYHNNRTSWRDDRVRSLTRPSHIELSLSDLEVTGTDPTGSIVRFHLNYQSPSYADRTLKELVLGPDVDGQLRILRELNLDVETQPNGRLAATASTTTTPQGQQAASAATATATHVGQPMVIQPNAELPTLPNNRNNINQFISRWLNSWQHKDLDGYFSHYVPQFKAPLMASVDAWRDERTVKIIRPAVIQLQLESMELVNENSEGAVLHLTLAYHSTYYADRTQKELRLQRTSDGSLQIVEEKNIAVEALPLARLLPSNNVAMLQLARSIVANQL